LTHAQSCELFGLFCAGDKYRFCVVCWFCHGCKFPVLLYRVKLPAITRAGVRAITENFNV
jgi:hypothetical protein